MNNFHRFQNFGKFLICFRKFDWKKRHTSLFSRICREIRTNFTKNSQKNAQFDSENEKIGNSLLDSIHSRKHVDDFWLKFWDLSGAEDVNIIDLVKSFPTSIYLQKSASIQPRTSPSKFGGKFNSLFTSLLTRAARGARRAAAWR